VAAQLVSTRLDADDILRAVGIAFGLPVRTVGKAILLGSLEAFFCKLAVDNKRALLIVDEAQNLTSQAIEELRMLSNFQLEEKALLQSFLVGQPELRTMMHGQHMQQLRQRVIASYHLGPLDKDETQGYIEHRLKHVGWKGDPRFERGCFDQIHMLTGGVPRRINTLCNRLLLAGFLAEKHVLDTPDAQAIAREMREELGPDATLGPVLVASDAALGQEDIGPGTESPETWREHFRRIEERIDRLEKTVSIAVDLLHAMRHPDKANNPGTPAGR